MPATWKKWTDDEDAIIRSNYHAERKSIGVDICVSALPGRSRSAILSRARILGVSMRNHGQIPRFMRKIRITPGCWIWIGGVDRAGYGFHKWNGRKERANRVSYIHYFGLIPDGLFVCHKCDNPACVNPDHLFVGTREENMIDMVKKGRQFKSSAFLKGIGKLSDEQALEIISSPLRNADLAVKFDVDASLISHIRHGRARKHLHEVANEEK